MYSPTRTGASSPYQVKFSTQVRKLVPLPTGDNSPLAVGVTIDPTKEEGEPAVRSHNYGHNGMGKDRRIANDPGLVEQRLPDKIQTVPASVPPRQQVNAEGEKRLYHGSHTRISRTGSNREALTAVTRRINVVMSRLKTTLLAKHIPGVDNCEADRLSRIRDPSNWSLN